MTDCKINFTEGSDPLAYGIYQDLLEAGASCNDLDHGYNVTNYAGLYCPKKDARSCVIGKGDGVVEADEVKEYALDNYEQAKYRQIIEGRTGDPLPWVLDDLDPKIDAEIRKSGIRERVQAAIDELKRIIKEKGIKEGSDKYKEMLAAGLTWFVATPPIDKAAGKIVMKEQLFQRTKDGIKKDGLEGFWEYLEDNGGIRVKGGPSDKYTAEYTAIEALKNKKGKCSEISKILFAVMKMAGFNPIFVHEDILKEKINDPLIKEAIEDLRGNASQRFHVCIGLYIGKRIRFFDPSVMSSNLDYKYYTPVSLKQYLSMDYLNRGVWSGKAIANYTRAIEIDPKFAWAYFKLGVAWYKQHELDKAIANYTRAIEVDPKFANAYFKRGVALEGKDKLDEAMADYTRAIEIDPKFAQAYYNRGVILEVKGKLDEAMADYAMAIEFDSKFAEAYNNHGAAWADKGYLDKAIADMAKAAALDQSIYYNNLLTVTKLKWQSAEELKNSASIFRNEMGGADISEYEAQFALAYALWEFKKYEEAREMFGGILTDLSFKAKPSKSTTDFFNGMLRKMPAPMKKDKGVQEILKSLRKKMK